MINNFNKKEDILEYLMTSEFLDDELTPSEMRELLLKFRYFYRSSHAKQESLKYTINRLEDENKILEKKALKSKDDKEREERKYEKILDRDLSLKERLFGKIFEMGYDRKFHLFKNKHN